MGSYPYEDLAWTLGTTGAKIVGLAVVTYLVVWLLVRIIARHSLPLAPFVAAAFGSLAALCVLVVFVVRLHWYAGEADDCFLSEGAIFTIVLGCPAGLLLCAGAIIALRFSDASLARGASSILIAVMACALAVRLGHLLTLHTEDGADATHLVGCTKGG